MIRFLVFGDLHYDSIEDGNQRLKQLVDKIKEKKPDFVVSLGDLCYPREENKKVLEQLQLAGGPIYHIIGNHDTEQHSLVEAVAFLGLSNSYYSVRYKEYKLIFLNTCFFHQNGENYSYLGKNYRNADSQYPIVPMEEFEWLRKELTGEEKYIIFSHHSLVNDFRDRGVNNRENIRELFKGKDVILCMNGHDHGDSYDVVDNISYVTVNSATYVWAGQTIDSSKELKAKYGHLRGILPYKEALCALVEIDDKGITIHGMTGEYRSVKPEDIGINDYRYNGVSIQPRISSHYIEL